MTDSSGATGLQTKSPKIFLIIEKTTFYGFLLNPIEATGFAYKSQCLLFILPSSLVFLNVVNTLNTASSDLQWYLLTLYFVNRVENIIVECIAINIYIEVLSVYIK